MDNYEKLEEYYFINFAKRDLVHDYVSLMRAHYGDESVINLSEYITGDKDNGQQYIST